MLRRWMFFGVPLYGAVIFLGALFAAVIFLGAVGRFSSMESSALAAMLLLAILSMGVLLYGFHSTNRDIRLDQKRAREHSSATD